MLFRILMLVMLVLASGIRPAHAETETTFDRIMRTGTIKCGYGVWPPLIARDANTGTLTGPIPDIVNELGRRLELKVEWAVEGGFGNAVADLAADKYDIFCGGMWPTGVRGKYVDFSSPLFITPMQVYVRAEDHRFDANPALLNTPEIKMAVMDGEMTAMIQPQDFPASGVFSIMNGDNSGLMLAVATGKADFTTLDPGSVAVFEASNPGQLRPLPGPPLRVPPVMLPLPKGDSRLQQTINIALVEMQATGALERILSRYDASIPGLLRVPPLYAPPQ